MTALALIVVAISVGAIALRDLYAPSNNAEVAGTPAAAITDAAFRAGFRPLVERAATEAQVLVDMGEDRERNLFRIRGQQREMLESLTVTDDWLRAHPPPTALASAAAAYQDGAISVRAAMDEAQSGLLQFDFDRVARATEKMKTGAAALHLAVSRLDDGDSATTGR